MKAIQYITIAVFAVVILYYMSSTLQGMAEVAVTDSINFVAPGNNSTSVSVDTTYPVRLYNATQTCTAGNYTYNKTHVTLKASQYCEDGDYSFTYTHQNSTSVWGMDLAFVAILVFIGSGIFIIIKLRRV